MNVEIVVALGIAVLGSSVLVALVNWRKDKRFIAAQEENLSTLSLREALEAVRAELQQVRDDLDETRRALDQALDELHAYRQLLRERGLSSDG